MSQERSISSDSLIDLRQSHYPPSLNLDQSSDQVNLNGLSINETSLNEPNVQINHQPESRDLSVIDLTDGSQTIYFHPSFLQLNSSPQSNQIADHDSIELNTLNSDERPTNNEHDPPNARTTNWNRSIQRIQDLRNKNSFHHSASFEWEMYSDRNRVLKELRKNQKFVDVQLIADDGYCEYVHSTVISALGKGLADCIFSLKDDPKTPCTILDSDNLKNHVKQIRLHGISGPVLKVIVNCAYTGFIETDNKQVIWSILDIAERFAMTDVLRACCIYLIYQLNVDNCVKLLHLGIKFKHKLRTAAWNFIRLKFDRIVNECADYIHLSIDELTKLLEDDHLNTVTGEQIVWSGICRWILADLFNRTKHLNRLLEKLRFGRLPLEYLEVVLANEPLLIEIDKGVFNFNNAETSQTDQAKVKSNESVDVKELKSNEAIQSKNKEINLNLISSSSKSDTNLTTTTKKSSQEQSQSLNFEDANTSKVLSLVKRMICIRKNRQNQYKTDNRNLLADLSPYFVRPRVPAEVLFVIGGWQENMITTLIETYDVRTNMWLESHISLEYTRAYHGLEVLNGLLYIIGGTNGNKTLSSMHCFNPNNGKWYERANMYERRCYVNTTILNDLIYAMGGHNGAQRLNSVEKYDYKTNQWLQSSPMNLARSDASAATYDNKIYIAGGLNEHVQNTVEFYNPVDDTWTFIQPMQYQRNSLSLILYSGYLFALGGTNGSSRLNTVERYDFNAKSWTLSKPMSCSRSTFSACVLEDKLYVVGGHDQHSQLKSVEYYDIQTDQWYEVKNLKRSRSGFNLCCYRSFTVSSKFTYNYYIERQAMKNKKNVLKNKDQSTKPNEPSSIGQLSSRVNRKDLNSISLPTISTNRFRRRRNQFRFSNIYPTNLRNSPSVELNRSSENQLNQLDRTTRSYPFNRSNPVQQDTVINIDMPSHTGNVTNITTDNLPGDLSRNVPDTYMSTNRSNSNFSTHTSAIHTQGEAAQSSTSRQELNLSSQNHSQTTNQITYPSTSGQSADPSLMLRNDSSSSTSSSDLESPWRLVATNRIFETRSLNNDRLVDQEDDPQNDFDHQTI